MVKKIKKRLLISTASIIILLIIILSVTGYILISASLPFREGTIRIKGLQADVEIFFDKKGIPQIWAKNEKDAWLAVGWLHASDRLFQMELTRRVSQGRLSEWFGNLTLKYDRQQRIINHQEIARRSLKNIGVYHKEILQAYVSGINQCVDQAIALPFEFYILGSDYEPWEIVDVLTLFSFQTWFSDVLQNNDEFYISLAESLGMIKTDQIIVPYPFDAPKTVPQPEFMSKLDERSGKVSVGKDDWKQSIVKSLFSDKSIPFQLTRASNAWVISPNRSHSGYTIFANDPHLEVSRLPQFWYVLGVHTDSGELDMVGITTPGIPSVVMGHNGDIAWAFTAAAIDITDEYIEKVNPENPDEYLQDDQYVPFNRRIEYIKVNGSERIDTLVVKSTRNGPVIKENEAGTEVYTIHWAGFDFLPSRAVVSGFEMAKCTDFETFRRIVTNFAALDANWLYADKSGNIGYQLGTPVPVRNIENSKVRLPGWSGNYSWNGYYSLDEVPHAYNPVKGWLASCNNKPDDKNLTFHLAGNFADGRIRRIEELLSFNDHFSVDDMKKFQLDLISLNILQWKSESHRVLLEIGENEWAERVQQWQGSTDTNSMPTALLETWLLLLNREIFEDNFPRHMQGFYNQTYNRERNLLSFYFSEDSMLFDDARTDDIVERRKEIAVRAMRKAVQLVDKKTWGEVQTLTIAHPMAEVPLLSSLLSLRKGPFPRPGVTSSLNNSTAFWDEKGHFVSRGGPSWRFILDFSIIDQAQIVVPGGQSGHPLSPHFFDFYSLWEKGEYWTLPFSKDKVVKQSVSRVLIIPEKRESRFKNED